MRLQNILLLPSLLWVLSAWGGDTPQGLWQNGKWDKPITPDREVLAYQIVNIEKDLLLAGNNKLFQITLPDGKVLTLEKIRQTQVGKDAFVWHGRIKDDPLGSATFSVVGNTVVGDIVSTKGSLYRLKSLAPGIGLVQTIDPRKLPHVINPVYPVAKPPNQIPPVKKGGTSDSGKWAPNSLAIWVGTSAEPISVMVCYTPLARDREGSTDAIKARIVQAVEEANQSYRNSGADLELALAGSGTGDICEVSGYKEQDSILQDLNALEWDGDHRIDHIHALRDTLAADIVVLIVERSDAAGLANQMFSLWVDPAFEEYAFAVVTRNVATGKFGFAHELGHLMGAHHDDPASGPAAFEYSYGHVDPSNTVGACVGGPWMTLMSQYTNCLGCVNIQYWSSQGVTSYTSGGITCTFSMGSKQADNRQTLESTASIVRGFRP